MKSLVISVLVALLLVQLSTPVIAATPASIDIDPHVQNASTDQVIRFTATVKDSSGNPINEPITDTLTVALPIPIQ